jgi:hypothetical protein
MGRGSIQVNARSRWMIPTRRVARLLRGTRSRNTPAGILPRETFADQAGRGRRSVVVHSDQQTFYGGCSGEVRRTDGKMSHYHGEIRLHGLGVYSNGVGRCHRTR